MKLFLFIFIAIASLATATPNALRDANNKGEMRKLGPANPDEVVTIDREYNEEGQPPAGRQVRIDPEHPAEEPEDMGFEKIMKPADDEHVDGGHRELYYNCYSYCWWNSWYGYITYCCPWWGCGYYYC